jgi:hypothetical protein
MLQTEKFYVTSLQLVITVYLEPWREDARSNRRPLLPLEDLNVLFSGWEVIHKLNAEFLRRLEVDSRQRACVLTTHAGAHEDLDAQGEPRRLVQRFGNTPSLLKPL